jgi:hypothetical protein
LIQNQGKQVLLQMIGMIYSKLEVPVMKELELK